NILVVADFNLNLIYSLTRYEGSTNDGTVLKAALNSNLKILTSRYYLANSGYL
ncbi:hypothetical protein CERZMDRAFT_33765, partial [Cercospora zeae-maydis SCOH1-5]